MSNPPSKRSDLDLSSEETTGEALIADVVEEATREAGFGPADVDALIQQAEITAMSIKSGLLLTRTAQLNAAAMLEAFAGILRSLYLRNK